MQAAAKGKSTFDLTLAWKDAAQLHIYMREYRQAETLAARGLDVEGTSLETRSVLTDGLAVLTPARSTMGLEHGDGSWPRVRPDAEATSIPAASAHCTAFTTLANSARTLSPAELTNRQ
jgi:hypothetical protein